MAGGAEVENIIGYKAQLGSDHNPSNHWHTFSEPRRSSLRNCPDIVDDELHLQPSSGRSNQVTGQVNGPSVSNSVGLVPTNYDVGENSAGSMLLSDPHQVDMSRVALPHLYPSLSSTEPQLPISQNHGSRPPQIPSYRQIQTRDIGVGVTARAETLPDLLHSHIANPVASARPNQHRQARNGERRTRPVSDPRTRNTSRHRTHEATSRTGHRSRTRSTSSLHSDDGACKEPCIKCLVKVTSFRWVLVVLSLLGVCCVVTGIVLAALHAAGNSFLFLAIMFIGLGVLLVIVVGVGWKCTPRGHEPLHALFNIGDFRRRRERHARRAYRQRDSNWYGGVMYPEFQYRRPPPTYAASMQEYNQQLLLAQQQYIQQQQQQQQQQTSTATDTSLPNSPPPSYRSRTSTIHSGIHMAFPPDSEQPNSRPPTYRSNASTRRAPVRPPLPRDIVNYGDRGDNLPGADVSFAGPDVGSAGVVEALQTSSSVPYDNAVGSSNVQGPEPSNNLDPGIAVISGDQSVFPYSQIHVTYPSRSTLIPGSMLNVDESPVGVSNAGLDVSSSATTITVVGTSVHQRQDNFDDPELQQTLQTFDEITSLSADSPTEVAVIQEQTVTDEAESYQTAL